MMNRKALFASLLVGVLAVAAPVTLGNFFRLSSVPTADLPPAASVNTGALVYDSTAGAAKLSNGSSWKTLSLFDNDGGVTAVYPTRDSTGTYGLFVPLDAGTINLYALGTVQLSTTANSNSIQASGADVYLNGAKNYFFGPLEAEGGQTAQLQSPLGAGASDVVAKIGSTVSDGSVNASAKLWSVRTGVGGSEVEKLYVDKSGDIRSPAIGLGRFRGSSTTSGLLSIDDTVGAKLAYGNQNVSVAGSILLTSDNNYTNAYVGTGTTRSSAANSGTAVGHIFDTLTSWTNVAAKVVSFRSATVEMAAVTALGRFDQSGSDSSGSPGDATINKPVGKSAIASGATTVTITNSNVASGDQVFITWHGDLGAQSKIPWVTTTAGSFTVNVGTAPGTNVAFCWTVAKRL